MAQKVKRRSTVPATPSLRCALCYEHPKRFGSIGMFFPKDGSAMCTYVLCAKCAKAVGRKPTPAQMARIESYISC